MFVKTQSLSRAALQNPPSQIILDVRSAEEFAQAHVPGARNIPVHELKQRHSELGSDKNVRIVVYCRSGARSATAARALAELGFTQIQDIGPMSRWAPQSAGTT